MAWFTFQKNLSISSSVAQNVVFCYPFSGSFFIIPPKNLSLGHDSGAVALEEFLSLLTFSGLLGTFLPIIVNLYE